LPFQKAKFTCFQQHRVSFANKKIEAFGKGRLNLDCPSKNLKTKLFLRAETAFAPFSSETLFGPGYFDHLQGETNHNMIGMCHRITGQSETALKTKFSM
jgi:hypothetical protein